MSFVSIGDLSRGFALRTQNVEVRARLNRLSEELATGVTADPSAHLRGDFRALGSIERSLTVMDSYDLATKEAALGTDVMQQSLGQLSDASDTVSTTLLNAASMGDARTIHLAGNDALARMSMSVSALNVQIAGKTLFAGAATGGAALAPADDILSAVKGAVSGLTTSQDVLDAIDVWFDTPGGGFDTLAYQGSDDPMGPTRLNDGNSLSMDMTAADPAIRDVLKSLTTVALLADETFLNGDHTQRSTLAGFAGNRLLSATNALTALRGELGSAQAQIETVSTENAASRNLLELARSDMLAVNPYETATGLQAAESQLETIYTVTARLSRLSLTNYL